MTPDQINTLLVFAALAASKKIAVGRSGLF
jgi:hypothetical protein